MSSKRMPSCPRALLPPSAAPRRSGHRHGMLTLLTLPSSPANHDGASHADCGRRRRRTESVFGPSLVFSVPFPPTCPLCPRLQDLLGCIIFVRSAWERMQSNAVRINSLQISSLLVQRAWCVAGGVLAATAAECVSRRLDLLALWWITIHEVETTHVCP